MDFASHSSSHGVAGPVNPQLGIFSAVRGEIQALYSNVKLTELSRTAKLPGSSTIREASLTSHFLVRKSEHHVRIVNWFPAWS